MIYGIGTDFVEIARIRRIILRSGDRFAGKILNTTEWQIYRRNRYPVNFLAKRFAAKEAAAKAFGFGICNGLFFKDFEICNDMFGKPMLRLFSHALLLFHELSLSKIHVTLSDDRYYAFAIVVFEK